MKTKLSVAIATFNEEENIGRCLEAVLDIADEIIVVDGSSTDKTREIARDNGAEVIKTTNKPIFHINKQMAIDKCQGDWILQLDADEVVSPKLAKEISKVINMSNDEIVNRKLDPEKTKLFNCHQRLLEQRDGKYGKDTVEVAAFFVPRRNYFLDRFLMHTAAYPDGVIRLIKNGKAKFPCESVHEQIEINGRVAWLENDLLHYADTSFQKYLTRSNRYTSLTANQLLNSGIKPSFWQFMKAYFKAEKTFWSLFLRHKGFMDGFPGFVFSAYSALHHITAYIKFWEEYRKQGSSTNQP